MANCSTKARKAKWYRKNRKRLLAKQNEYNHTHDRSEYTREYQEKNREVIKERNKKSYEKYREKRLEYAREHYQEHKYEIKAKRMGLTYGTDN